MPIAMPAPRSTVPRRVPQGSIRRRAGADASRESKQANGDQPGSRRLGLGPEPSVKPSRAWSSSSISGAADSIRIRKNVVCRQNVRWSSPILLLRRRSAQQRLESLLREPLPSERAQRLGPPPSLAPLPFSALGLRIECRDRVVGDDALRSRGRRGSTRRRSPCAARCAARSRAKRASSTYPARSSAPIASSARPRARRHASSFAFSDAAEWSRRASARTHGRAPVARRLRTHATPRLPPRPRPSSTSAPAPRRRPRRPPPSSWRPSPGRPARRPAAAARRRPGRHRAAPGCAGGSCR